MSREGDGRTSGVSFFVKVRSAFAPTLTLPRHSRGRERTTLLPPLPRGKAGMGGAQRPRLRREV